MSELIITRDHGVYAHLTINRPEKRNAMNEAARKALRQALAALHGKHKVIVITGAADVFCSGMDLKESVGLPDAAARKEAASREWIETLLDVRRHPAIVIAAVNGIALGGGTSLINVADLAIAADEAEIGMPEIGFATYPAMAGPSTQLMLPAKRAAWLVLTAKRLNGRKAEEWGLVNQSVPRAELETMVDALARHVAQFDGVALTGCKRALETVPNRISDWPSAFDYGQTVNAGIRDRSQGQAEGLARFAAGQANPGQGKPT